LKISFCIPSFNSVTWLPHACSSVLQQTHKDIELVVVDDGSTDRTQEYTNWLRKSDERVQVVHNGKNLGRSESRNIGNRAASGDVICVLDADDLTTPNRAELTARKFAKGGAEYVYGSATVIDVLGRPSHILQADVLDKAKCFDEAKNPRLENRIVHSTVAYTKDFANRFKYRDGELAKLGLDDWAMQAEAIAAGVKFDFIPQRLACYRQLDSQVTKTRDQNAVMAAKRGFLAGLGLTASHLDSTRVGAAL